MKVLADIMELWAHGGDACLVAADAALSAGIVLHAIPNEEAEHDRVTRASCNEYSVLDRPIPWAPRPVRCGGLRAIEVEEGGDLKGWMAARISRLWRRRKGRVLFEYLTKTAVRLADGTRGRSIVRKKQRWETKDYVDLELGDSAAHLSGIGGGTLRGVAGPRGNDVEQQVINEHNEQIAMNLERDFEETP